MDREHDYAMRRRICGLDYSHVFVTDVNHLLAIYQCAKDYAGEAALEVGSFWGHGTFALTAAGMNVTACDPDLASLPRRRELCPTATFEPRTGADELLRLQQYSVVFHDSYHGEQVVPELLAYWRSKVLPGGLLIVHDVEQFDLRRFLDELGWPVYSVTYDARGRALGCFWKPQQ